jgi:putative ABC transport system permease protein
MAGSQSERVRRAAEPPRLAERLLAATVRDEGWRDSIVGDLREEFAGIAARLGHRAARRWYWRQALAIGGTTLMARTPFSPRRSSLLVPDSSATAGWHAGLLRDLQYAWRAVARRPGTSAVIIVTLALALSANSTSFAIFDAIVLRPFRFPHLDRVVMVVSSDPNQGLLDRESVARADFQEWRRETRTVEHLAAAEWWDANLSGIDQPEQVPGRKVTAGFFEALGVAPVLGRTILPVEETPGQHRRVILGHGLWARLFSADPQIVGTTVRLDGEPFEVVGVAPPGFSIPEGSQLWVPLAYSADEWTDRRNRWLVTVGRLREGVTIEQAGAEFSGIAERQRREHPDTNANLPNAVVTFTRGMQDPGAGAFLSVMLGASALLLLIACANIANLLLARGSERSQEFALRIALGGSRLRLLTQLMTEAAMLTTIAIVLAIPLASIGLALSRASIPPSIVRFVPGWDYLAISPTVFAVTALAGISATILFALVPAWQTLRAEVSESLRQGGRTTTAGRQRHWLRHSLAGAQVAITLALLFGALLMMGAADRAVNGVMGFDKRGLLVARLVLPDASYADAERRRQFITGVLDRLRAIPAVSHAAMVSNLPYGGNNQMRQLWLEGVTRESDVRTVDYRRITSNYFETMRIPLLAGRLLDTSDRAGTVPVAVISRSLADRYWPGNDPLGRQFRLSTQGQPESEPLVVVGVVGDVLHDWFQQRRAPTVYTPLAQDAPFSHAFVARTVGDPLAVAGDVRRAVKALDPDQPILSLQTMENLIEDRTAGINFIARTIIVVASIALLLAVMGLYSLMTFLVSRRTQELGVRLALGASQWQIVGVTIRQGVWITVGGLIVGAAVATMLGRVMESTLYGIVSLSVWPLLAMVALVAFISMLASYLPARRTARLDPTTALRTE